MNYDSSKTKTGHAPSAGNSASHHRWKLKRSQIEAYGLTESLNSTDWIVAIEHMRPIDRATAKVVLEAIYAYPPLTVEEHQRLHGFRDSGIKSSHSAFPEVPRIGQGIVSLLSGEMREAVLGDLAERFEKRVAQRGEQNARVWFWWQVTRTTAQFSLRWVRRLVELDAVLQRIGF